MSTEQIVALLTAERDRLNQAITLLSGTTTSAAPARRRGRPPGKKAAAKLPTPTQATPETAKPARRKRQKLGAEARARIAEAQRKRWAEFRKK